MFSLPYEKRPCHLYRRDTCFDAHLFRRHFCLYYVMLSARSDDVTERFFLSTNKVVNRCQAKHVESKRFQGKKSSTFQMHCISE